MDQNHDHQPVERSEKQRAASRANGSLSRGPVTPAGKAASSRNALRHGLTSKTLTLANENPEMLDSILNGLTEEFQPETDAECMLVLDMAQAKWLQYRIWLSETSHLNQKMAETANAVTNSFAAFDESLRTAIAIENSLQTSRTLELHSRIDARCNRQFHRALNLLRKLRKESKNEKTNLTSEPQRDRLCDPPRTQELSTPIPFCGSSSEEKESS
jgi:hypothetical protein